MRGVVIPPHCSFAGTRKQIHQPVAFFRKTARQHRLAAHSFPRQRNRQRRGRGVFFRRDKHRTLSRFHGVRIVALSAALAAAGVVDRGIVQYENIKIAHFFSGIARLKSDAHHKAVARGIGEDFFADPPFSVVRSRVGQPQHRPFVREADIVFFLCGLERVLEAEFFLRIHDDELQRDILHAIQCGIENFRHDPVRSSEINFRRRARGGAEKILARSRPFRPRTWRTRRILRRRHTSEKAREDKRQQYSRHFSRAKKFWKKSGE